MTIFFFFQDFHVFCNVVSSSREGGAWILLVTPPLRGVTRPGTHSLIDPHLYTHITHWLGSKQKSCLFIYTRRYVGCPGSAHRSTPLSTYVLSMAAHKAHLADANIPPFWTVSSIIKHSKGPWSYSSIDFSIEQSPRIIDRYCYFVHSMIFVQIKAVRGAVSKCGRSQAITWLCTWHASHQPRVVFQKAWVRIKINSVILLNADVPVSETHQTEPVTCHTVPFVDRFYLNKIVTLKERLN
jgi:hypothetical protein